VSALTEIPLTKPFFSEAEANAAKEVVQSGWLCQGKKVKEFEEKLAYYVAAETAVASNSCTAALHISMQALGIGSGDEVICPSFSFIASSNSILHAGAKPVFVEIEEKTFNIDPANIEAAISPATKAILPVHQIGLPADLDAVAEIAEKHGLLVIEDAACAIGSEYKGKKIGGCDKSAAACFSFHPRKLIVTGEGGMITTDDSALAEKARAIRSHGASISDLERHRAKGVVYECYGELGYNYRMTDIAGAIGIEQMEKLGEILKKRAEIAEFYNKEFEEVEELSAPFVPDYAKHNWQSYLLRLTKQSKISRDEVIKRMAEKGISCRRGIPPIHKEPYYKNLFGNISLPVTEKVSEDSFFIPIFPGM